MNTLKTEAGITHEDGSHFDIFGHYDTLSDGCPIAALLLDAFDFSVWSGFSFKSLSCWFRFVSFVVVVLISFVFTSSLRVVL